MDYTDWNRGIPKRSIRSAYLIEGKLTLTSEFPEEEDPPVHDNINRTSRAMTDGSRQWVAQSVITRSLIIPLHH